MSVRASRVLVITDHPEVEEGVLAAVRERALRPPGQFRVLVPNPTHAEAHLFHPELHLAATAAQHALTALLPTLERAAGGPVSGAVSIRHDPYNGVEVVMAQEPVDEFIVGLSTSGLSRGLHLDLAHRLAHFGLPVHVVAPPLPVAAG